MNAQKGDSADRKKPPTEIDRRRSKRLERKYKERCVEEPELNQKKLAQACNMSESTVSRMLSGDLPISVGAALLLARRLFCHPGEFHDEFVDFTAAESWQNVQAFSQFEKLSDKDQETARRFLASLSDKNTETQ